MFSPSLTHISRSRQAGTGVDGSGLPMKGNSARNSRSKSSPKVLSLTFADSELCAQQPNSSRRECSNHALRVSVCVAEQERFRRGGGSRNLFKLVVHLPPRAISKGPFVFLQPVWREHRTKWSIQEYFSGRRSVLQR